MTIETSGRDNKGRSDDTAKQRMQNNDDDITEIAGGNRRRNSGVEEEKLIKWQLPGHHDITSAKRALIQLLFDLMMTNPKDITIIDSKQREWNFHDSGDDKEKF